jgi:superfamily II DNA or RNA helicase
MFHVHGDTASQPFLEIEMLQLRPHQKEVVDKLSEGFEHHRCQILYAPTGFGKTEVAMAIMQEVARKYKRTAIVLDRVVLVEQTSLRLGKYHIDHGVIQRDHWRSRPHLPIQVCSAQTLEKRGIIPDIDLLIIDECHVQRRKTVELIKNNPHLKVIGLTATPFTDGLANTYTNVIGALPTGELIDNGWLAPLKVYIAKEIDMTGVKKVAGEWTGEAVAEQGMKITGDIVAEWVKKTYEIFEKPEKTIVFCSGVEHGRDLEKAFKEAGHNFVSISYKENDDFKRETIEEFAKPDSTIKGLIATDILTRGFDVSDVRIGVSARPFSKSFSSHVQQLGRVMRPHEGKEFGVWLDHSGNYLRFRDDWDKLYDHGVEELKDGSEKTKKEPTLKEKKEACCPSCGGLWTSGNTICDECGFERKKPNHILVVPGEMQELQAANRKLIINNQKFYSQIIYYAKSKGYKDGWAFHKYKEKFGVEPRGLHTNPEPPEPATMNWIKSRLIAYAKGKAR